MRPKLKQAAGKELLYTLITLSFYFGVVFLLPPHRKALIMLTMSEWGTFVYRLGIFLIPIMFGMVLGIPALLSRWKTHTGFNWMKLALQGIPALFLVIPLGKWNIYHLLSITADIHSMPNLSPWAFWESYPNVSLLCNLACVWLGKVLVDCIKGKLENDGYEVR
ncbi:MAG: hypothetical protein FH756_20800 [Firmicutes bacterium]|nr:hypothetical protein [Bacillota bacterium]